jgi:hypothetical protein
MQREPGQPINAGDQRAVDTNCQRTVQGWSDMADEPVEEERQVLAGLSHALVEPEFELLRALISDPGPPGAARVGLGARGLDAHQNERWTCMCPGCVGAWTSPVSMPESLHCREAIPAPCQASAIRGCVLAATKASRRARSSAFRPDKASAGAAITNRTTAG